MINQIKQLIGIKTIAEHSGKTERQVYNLLHKWEKGISKGDKHLLQSAIEERIEELTELSRKLEAR
jgi:hypothetical protein